MQIITTHMGADFDAFASMVAARRLHPEAALFFPGSREESLRRMLETELVVFTELKRKQIDPAALTRVVLCDTRQRHRLGIVGRWLAEHPGIELIAYDHHLPAVGDLEPVGGVVDAGVGCTATLMVEELRRRDIGLPANEATVLLMGIYEDTGSLTHVATSRRDFEAAGWLLEQGGELAAVRRFAVASLDPRHLEILHRMTRSLTVRRIRGHRVGVTAVELGEYVDELAPLANRCVEIFELPLLFAIFGEGDAATLIARGDASGVDLGAVMAEFAGGGGHPPAASARLHGETALEVRERLLAHLAEKLPAAARAVDLAVRDFVSVPAGTLTAEAKELLVRRRVNAAPVVAPGGAMLGAVTRQTLDAALQHGLGDRPVERVMDRELEWVEPDAPAEEVGRRMLTRHPRFVLVGDRDSGRAEGLVTRMQVLRHLHGRLADEGEAVDRRTLRQPTEHREAVRLLAERLPPALGPRVEAAAGVSRASGVPVYLVGGLVRDLILGRENRDLDLVVEGDGIAFARELAVALDGRVREHREFLTAVVVDPEGFHLDVATARSEFYRAPAALPEVATSAIRQDLFRRDFTINTLAIRLGPDPRPALIDHFGGRDDLDAGVLRVLHSMSFIDDPTRVLRAVRLEQRLGLRMSAETVRLVEVALDEGVFTRLSGSRLREELVLLLDDPALALPGIERLDDLGLLAELHPALALGEDERRRLWSAVGAWDWYRVQGLEQPPVALWRLLLAALTAGLDEAGRRRLADRLQLAGDNRRTLLGGEARRTRLRERLAGSPAPHQVVAAFDRVPGEDLLLLLAGGGADEQHWVRRYLRELRGFELTVRGADLVAAGVTPGPAIGAALERTREARLDGAIGAGEELGFALERAAAETASEPAVPVGGGGEG